MKISIYIAFILLGVSCGEETDVPESSQITPEKQEEIQEDEKSPDGNGKDDPAEKEGSVNDVAGGQAFVLGSIGDSITAGFLSGEENNWSTGNELTSTSDNSSGSIANEIRWFFKNESKSYSVKTENFAVSGDKMGDIPAQIDLLKVKNPDIVTILIGANDVCSS